MKRTRCVFVAVIFSLATFITPRADVKAEAKGKPIELRISSWMPAKSVDTAIAETWIKMVEERTGGRVHFTLYTAGALGSMKDQYDLVIRGVADLAFHTLSNNPGRHPISEVLHLPFVIPSSEVGGKVFWQLYQEFPEIRAEFMEVKVIGLGTIDTWNFHTLRKPIHKMEDLKGLKFRVPGGIASEAVKALGAVPVGIPVPELYLALQKGVVDGTVMGWEGVKSFKIYELLKYYTDVGGFTTLTQGFFMNKDSFNRLPKDIQKIIGEELGTRWWAEQKGKLFHDKWAEEGRALARKYGGTIYYLPPEEKKRWVEKILPIRDEWVRKMEAKGVSGRRILNRALELVEKYK
ncbi:MAG: TRAP transporter substrate-binding protein [Deltaproteobacteria bacterium]|nr:TRAP transporter substrate-binding protein [Deltaproteobacteria bacterium]